MKTHCKKHGDTEGYVYGTRVRCKLCRAEAVVKCRQNTKAKLVEMAGGKCEICGYSKCQAALQFHHEDPSKKEFALSEGGFCRSWDKAVAEVQKCRLLCSRCHTEVEQGVTELPPKEVNLGEQEVSE